MAVIKCPSCGTPISVVEKKTGLWWGLGCLIAVFAIPVIVAVIGILAAIAIPSFIKARETSQYNACSANMGTLSAAKEQILVEKECKPGVVIPEQELSKALGKPLDSVMCPKGGRYILNPAGQDPECSVHGTLSHPNPEKARALDPSVER